MATNNFRPAINPDPNVTSKKPKLLHIGYPKCMSTTLQRDFFAKHPEITFLGWGNPSMDHGWVNDDLATVCEVAIRYEKVLQYDKKRSKNAFRPLLDEFETDQSRKLLCLSFESFSFTMHFDVDPVIKAQRLRELLGKDTKILFVIRNQLSLFRSYYFECVRGGYPGFFSDFIDFNYHYLFHSILSDLHYAALYNLYCKSFGKERVKVIPMELLSGNTSEELSNLCDFAEISNLDLPLHRHNDSSDLRYLQAVRFLNEKFPNNRGGPYFGWVDGEKLQTYWKDRLSMTPPIASDGNYALRMMIYRSAEAVVSEFVGDLQADYHDSWRERLENLYRDGNTTLARETGLDLQALGYPCS